MPTSPAIPSPPKGKFRRWLAAENHFHGKLFGASVAGIVAIVLLAAIFVSVTLREHTYGAQRDGTLNVLRITDRVEGDLANLESARRSYVAEHSPGDAGHLRRCVKAFDTSISELISLLGSSPKDAALVLEVQARALTRINATMAVVKVPGKVFSQVRNLDTPDDSIRIQLANFRSAKAESFEEANQRAEKHRFIQTVGFGVLCVVAITFLIASSLYSFAIFRSHLRRVQSAQAQTRSIVETTLDAVLTLNEMGRIQSLNPAGETMFGWAASELIGQPISTLVPQPHFFRDLHQLSTGTMTADGRRAGSLAVFPIELSVNSMKFEGQRQWVAIVRDITERRRGEETLKHISLGVSAATGEKFVKSLAQQLSRALQSDFAFIVEIGSGARTASNILTLAEKGELHSVGTLDLQNTACAVVLESGFRACLENARAQFPQDPLLAGLAIESFVALPLFDHHGQAVGVMGVLGRKPMGNIQIIESTLQIFAARAAAELERKRFAEDLAAEKDRLAVTLRSIGDGCITIDHDGGVVLMNYVAERLTGWTQELAAGVPLVVLFRVLNERTRRPCPAAIQHLIATGSAAELTGSAIIVAPDGSEHLIETNAAPIRDSSNRHVGTVLVFRDVTEKQLADQERRKTEKLESLGVAAGGIAHDFNNLLTAILGNLSLALFNTSLEESVADRLTAAKRACLRAQELAAQLLTFAKGGAPIKQAAAIAQLVQDTVSFSLRGTNVRCEFSIPQDLWAVEVDAGQISQVITNLTINAEQAMPAGGTLRVSCANFQLAAENQRLGLISGRYVRITLKDEGIGISEENIKKIFDPYFTTKPKGSGLGLATSYSIIKNHHGVIDVVSEPGEGTIFYVFLIASDKAVVAEPARTVAPVQGSGRVLVLDDEEAICALVTCALEPLGYQVTETNDALTAIRTYEEAMHRGQRFDLVISDLTIPGGMGGQEAVRRLIEIDPHVRVIVSSGYAGDPIMSRYRDYGFCGMIAKPYEFDALGRVVAEVLRAPDNVVKHNFLARKTA